MPGKLWFMKINILSSTSIAQITVVQFATEHRDTFDCLTSAQALSAKIVTVTEVGQGGSVNHLLVRNTSPHFVFFTDGDILIGARQNRVLNVSLLLAPHSETVVPVSCVEQGRWHPVSEGFAPADHSAPPSMRFAKASAMASRERASRDFSADQGQVWLKVAELQAMHAAPSATANLSDVFAAKQREFDNALRNLRPLPGANGVAILRRGKVIAVDAFNRCEALSDYLPRLVRGALLDSAPGQSNETAPPETDLARLIETRLGDDALRTGQARPSVGVGTERRCSTPDRTAFDLEYEGFSIHRSILARS